MLALSFLKSRIGQILATAMLLISGALGLIQYGSSKNKEKRRVQDLEDFVNAKDRIDGVEISDSRAAALKRLRDNGVIKP